MIQAKEASGVRYGTVRLARKALLLFALRQKRDESQDCVQWLAEGAKPRQERQAEA